MLSILKLMLPVIIPSWNFFDIIVPSPRIQYALLNNKDSKNCTWIEFRPRPDKLPVTSIVNVFILECKME